MKKIFTLFAIFACLPILLSAKGPAVIGGSTYTADTLSHYKVGPGTYYTAIHFYGPKDMRAFYLEIDATNPYLSFQSVLGRDSLVTCEGITNMAARKSKEGSRYFAGTNFGSYRNSGTRMCGRRPIGESSRIFGPSNIFHDKRRMLHLVRHLCRRTHP